MIEIAFVIIAGVVVFYVILILAGLLSWLVGILLAAITLPVWAPFMLVAWQRDRREGRALDRRNREAMKAWEAAQDAHEEALTAARRARLDAIANRVKLKRGELP